MTKKTAFLTTIFPMKDDYLHAFLESLNHQSYKTFDLIVLNDGYENFENCVRGYANLNIVELNCSGTPAENRAQGIEYVKTHQYDFLIFGDSDDYFDSDRVEISVELLADSDIVVNDLSLFDDKNGLYKQRYITSRVKDGAEIALDFIKDKNIFGLSNTAVKVSALNDVQLNKNLIAVDWYLFSVLLWHNRTAVFTNQVVTYYRQYSENTVGLGVRTKQSFCRGIEVKCLHYELMSKLDDQYSVLYRQVLKLKSDFESQEFTNESLFNRIENPLWWEEIKLTEEDVI